MKHFQILIIVFSFFQSCCAQATLNYNELDSKWKKDAMYMLSESYMRYKEKHDLERKIKSEIDLFMKFDEIYRYPFGNGINKLKNEIESKKIVYDSIICLTTQKSDNSNPEYLNPNFYYIFKGGKLIKVLIFETTKSAMSESRLTIKELEEEYLREKNKKDGDGLSLLIFTKIKTDWNFEIQKIGINCYLGRDDD